MTFSSRMPAQDMLFPGATIVEEFTGHKSRDELFQGVPLGNSFSFHAVVVERNRDISRVANNVNGSLVSRVKVLVALQDAWPGPSKQLLIGKEVNFRHARLNIGKRYRIVRVE